MVTVPSSNEAADHQPKIFIVCDHAARAANSNDILTTAGFTEIETVPLSEELGGDLTPVVAILLFDQSQGVDQVDWVSKLGASASCLILYDQQDLNIALECIAAGATGHLCNDALSDQLVSMVNLCCRDARMKAQMALQAAELYEANSRYNALIDNTPVCITLKDVDGKYLFTNGNFEQAFGRPGISSVGKTVFEVYPYEIAIIHAAIDRAVLESREPVVREVEQEGNTGSVRNIVVTKYPVFDADQNIVGIGNAGIDKTDLVRAERLLHRFFNVPLIGAAIAGPSSHWLQVNDGLCAMLGYTREELLASSWEPLTHPDDLQANLQAFEAAVNGEKGRNSYEKRFIHKDGSTVYTKIYWEFVRNSNGTIEHFLVLISDITDHVKTGNALRASEANLHQAQKMEALGQLTGGIAHDFNNILAVIMGNLELIDELFPIQDLKDLVAEALHSTRRGARLTEQLLSFGRRSTLMPKVIEVDAAIASMNKLFARVLPSSIHLEHEALDAALYASIDLSQFENALLNLALNARDAMPDGGQLTLKTEHVELNGEKIGNDPEIFSGPYLMISITDTGIGMDEEMLAQAIVPFFTSKPVGKGSGLGLSMVFGFAKQSGGTLNIESTLGVGTTVQLYFPTVSEPEIEIPPSTAEPSPTGSIDTCILVVDDERGVLEVVSRQLRLLGYSVAEAADGASAISLLDTDETIDLVLTDLVMAGDVQGNSVAKHARTTRPDLKVISMSGNGSLVSEADGHLFDKQLIKPMSNTVLAFAVRDVLEG